MKDPGYEDRILEICMREQVNALLPLFEDELDLLAQNRKKFEEKGITAIVSDAESVAVCRDKYGFFSLLQKNGLPVLYTSASLEEFDSDYAEGKIAFPVFVKPVRGCGSVGISRVDNRELLGVLCRYSKEPLLIQQYADGEEFGAGYLRRFDFQKTCSYFYEEKSADAGGRNRKIDFRQRSCAV